MKPVIRYLRLRCATPTAEPVPHMDGVLAVAAIKESAGLARLLLVDMGAWGRNTGASVTNAAETLFNAAHLKLIAGLGVPRCDTLVVERDRSGNFDWLLRRGPDAVGYRHAPLVVGAGIAPRSREAFVLWAGDCAQVMLAKVDAVREVRSWAGVEG